MPVKNGTVPIDNDVPFVGFKQVNSSHEPKVLQISSEETKEREN